MPEEPQVSTRGLRWSVRTRILAAMLVVTAIGLIAAGFTAYLVQRDRIMQDVDAQLLHSLESVRRVVLGPEPESQADLDGTAETPQAATFSGAEAVLETVLVRVLPGPNESSLGLIDGTPRFISIADTWFHLEDDPTLISRVVSETSDGSTRMGTHVSDLGDLRYIAVPIAVDGVDEQALFVTAIELNAELGEITTAFRTYAYVAFGAFIAVGLVGWFVAGRLLRPIRVLRETASRITATDLRERIEVTGNDDVSSLTRTVNDMLDRLEGSMQAQDQLLADVRHELKTPVTIVRGHLELLDEHRPEDVKETRELVLDELDRMTALIDDIAVLASSQGPHLHIETVDVGDLCEQIHAKSAAIGGHDWFLDRQATPEHTVVRLDAARMTQAMLQLVDNAAKYSPEGTAITIGSTFTAGTVQLWVADQGPGIAPSAQQRIFERFGRADTGRGIDGSGLGLSIVDAIAQAHGGRVTLDSSSQGSRFTIELPTEREEGAA